MNDTDTATAPPDEPKAEAPADLHPHAPEAIATSESAEAAPVSEPEPTPAPESQPAAVELGLASDQDPAPVADSPPELESGPLVHESVAEFPAEPEEPDESSEKVSVEAEREATSVEAAPNVEEEPKAKTAKRTKKSPKAAVADVAEATAEPNLEAAPADSETPTGTSEPAEATVEAPTEEPKPENKKKWYAIKVQSGREDTIKAAILRKVAIEGLEDVFGQIMIPYEEEIVKKTVRVKDKKTGEYTTQEKKVTRKKKKFQGYLFAELEFNDRILYLFRETSGVGDFLNLRGTPPVPEPMPEHEVQSMLTGVKHGDPLKKGNAKVKLDFEKGDRVRIRDGSFANQEGEVKLITEPKDPTDTPKVTVVVTLWGRPVDVDLDYWQVEKA